jgi:hypothetical protein
MFRIKIDTRDRYQKKVELVETSAGKEKLLGRKEGDIDVVSAINKLLKENNLKAKDIGEFTAHPGPGSFTGIKMGVTTANIFNWALGKKDLDETILPEYGREPNITLKEF